MSISISGSPTAGAPAPAGLGEWEHLTRQALAAERCGQGALAGCLHRRALVLALSLLQSGRASGPSADSRMAAFVVTHLNLADLHACAGEIDAAVDHLGAAHRTLMALLRDAQAGPALQQAALRHSRETHAALLAHLSAHGSHPGIVAALQAGIQPFPLAAQHAITVH